MNWVWKFHEYLALKFGHTLSSCIFPLRLQFIFIKFIQIVWRLYCQTYFTLIFKLFKALDLWINMYFINYCYAVLWLPFVIKVTLFHKWLFLSNESTSHFSKIFEINNESIFSCLKYASINIIIHNKVISGKMS